jgi:plastocyanin
MTSSSSRSRPPPGSHVLRKGALAVAAWLLPAALVAARVELRVRQPDGKPLAGAIFYAVPLDARRLPAPAPAVMDQRDRRFVPQLLPVQTGATVSFPNTDSISHHVYSFSPAKRFELYLPKGDRGRDEHRVTFDHAGVVALGCNIHDWMLAYILVVDTPFFARADGEGRAVLADVPPGRYRLVAWHPRITDPDASLQREVRLAADAGEPWELSLRSPLLPSRDQEPGFRDY